VQRRAFSVEGVRRFVVNGIIELLARFDCPRDAGTRPPQCGLVGPSAVMTKSTWGYLSGVADVIELEFWPEYDSGPLWAQGATSVDLSSLPLSEGLRARLVAWNDRYDDSKLPFENNDTVWLDAGKVLLREIRHELGDAYEVLVNEEWWDEEPSA
jgi:hypothetical protein